MAVPLTPLHFQMLGCCETHLSILPEQVNVRVHSDTLFGLRQLIKDAGAAGFDVRVASGFRSFERQLLIWNDKCLGKRPVMSREGEPLNVDVLSASEKVNAICRWSALPGASRHHWGTDIDIYDASALPDDYQLQLHPDEYGKNGIFAPMIEWLDEYLLLPSSPQFFRPYDIDGEGIGAEPWHLSYRPVADLYEQHLSVDVLYAPSLIHI